MGIRCLPNSDHISLVDGCPTAWTPTSPSLALGTDVVLWCSVLSRKLVRIDPCCAPAGQIFKTQQFGQKTSWLDPGASCFWIYWHFFAFPCSWLGIFLSLASCFNGHPHTFHCCRSLQWLCWLSPFILISCFSAWLCRMQLPDESWLHLI